MGASENTKVGVTKLEDLPTIDLGLGMILIERDAALKVHKEAMVLVVPKSVKDKLLYLAKAAKDDDLLQCDDEELLSDNKADLEVVINWLESLTTVE